jgi:hypothetical protein
MMETQGTSSVIWMAENWSEIGDLLNDDDLFV